LRPDCHKQNQNRTGTATDTELKTRTWVMPLYLHIQKCTGVHFDRLLPNGYGGMLSQIKRTLDCEDVHSDQTSPRLRSNKAYSIFQRLHIHGRLLMSEMNGTQTSSIVLQIKTTITRSIIQYHFRVTNLISFDSIVATVNLTAIV
jgi:hypothetical protein